MSPAVVAPDDLDVQRWALLHDAAEAYVTDIPWPLKAAGLVDGLARVEKAIMVCVAERFELSPSEPALVKELDLEILDVEADALLCRHPDWPKGTPRVPRQAVLDAWHEHSGSRGAWDALDFIARAALWGIASSADIVRLSKVVEQGPCDACGGSGLAGAAA